MSQNIIPLLGYTPQIGEGTFVASTAAIIGDVQLGKDCSVWYSAVLRGDVGPIRIGDGTNIQDGSVIHGTYKKAFATLGRGVTIGHKVTLHGCKIGDYCLIGMDATIMDLAEIPSRCIVGAGSLVTEGFKAPEEGWLILGRPAKPVRKLIEKELAFLVQSEKNYLMYKEWYQKPDLFKERP